MEARISLITLGVRDLSRARDFYQKLGFELGQDSNESVAFFRAGGVVLSLYGWKALAEDATLDSADGSGFRGVVLAHNVREKSQVAQVLAQAQAAGGKIIKPAQDVFWGGHSGYFADPEGQLWEVAWNPGFPLNQRGEIELP
jgi:uncharacterized protein